MRGTRLPSSPAKLFHRIIPAHAGNSRASVTLLVWLTDHLRACGELTCVTSDARALSGSSPRMRGTPSLSALQPSVRRIIPAHAGNSIQITLPYPSLADHPRACGELSPRVMSSSPSGGSSPRMRGTLLRQRNPQVLCRIIPAHAGNSRFLGLLVRVGLDHPRACGELDQQMDAISRFVGSSPRMRGTPRVDRH